MWIFVAVNFRRVQSRPLRSPGPRRLSRRLHATERTRTTVHRRLMVWIIVRSSSLLQRDLDCNSDSQNIRLATTTVPVRAPFPVRLQKRSDSSLRNSIFTAGKRPGGSRNVLHSPVWWVLQEALSAAIAKLSRDVSQERFLLLEFEAEVCPDL